MKDEIYRNKWQSFTEKHIILFRSNVEEWLENFAKLEEFVIKNKGFPKKQSLECIEQTLYTWLHAQKYNYKHTRYIMDTNPEIKIKWEEFMTKNEELFQTDDEVWHIKLNLLEEYLIIHNTRPMVNDAEYKGVNLRTWLHTQSVNYKKQQKNMKKDYIRKEWEDFIIKHNDKIKSLEEFWQEQFEKVEEYIIKYGKRPYEKDKDPYIKNLGKWVQSQVTKYNKSKHTMNKPEYRLIWENFVAKYPDAFKSIETVWTENLMQCDKYITKYNKKPSQLDTDKSIANLGQWIVKQKINYRKNTGLISRPEFKQQWEQFIKKIKI